MRVKLPHRSGDRIDDEHADDDVAGYEIAEIPSIQRAGKGVDGILVAFFLELDRVGSLSEEPAARLEVYLCRSLSLEDDVFVAVRNGDRCIIRGAGYGYRVDTFA